ncbi:phage tail protein [Salmonella enterica subsp. enterica]|nr:phage tail protein [Salmonella enterica subsp. enterica serovar Ball]
MAQSVITSAFEHLKAQEAAGGNRIIIDQFVFANIPGLNVTDTPPESEPLPPDAQIVHRQAVDRNGVVNENTVAYSVTLPESTGDFTFNWLGLVSSATSTLCMAVYLHPQEKIKTAEGKQGNTLVYSQIMEYAGASAATGITTPVSTWQIDFTARLHGMDEATRKAALDIYGPGLFLDDAFKLTAQATGQATFAPGIAYLRGLRVELGVPGTLTYSTGISQTVYIDAALTGTLTGENKATFSLTSQKSEDYIDSPGFAHYVEPVATISASGEITDIRKTRKPLNDRLDGEYLTRDGNLKEIADKGEQAQSEAREHMGLGNSATLNVGTKQGTVAAGDDSRITGAMQKDQNGADIPNKPMFIENLGLKETLNPTKRVSIGNIGTGAFDGSTPCINIGDSDSGFIGSADGVLDIYCNSAKVGYVDGTGLHMLAVTSTGNLCLKSDGRINFCIMDEGGTPRMWIFKDKGSDGIHINNGNDGGGDYVFHKDGSFYAPLAVRAGGSKKLAVRSDNNSSLSAHFNLWGDANRPTVIELDDDQGWHLYSQRNPDGSIVFTVNGDITANTLRAGGAIHQNNGDIFGSVWGNSWLSLWINNNFVRAVRLGPQAISGGLWQDYQLGGGNVVTGFHTDGDWEMQGGDDKVYYRPIQYLVNGTWVTAASA